MDGETYHEARQWITADEARRLYDIENLARRLLEYEYPHPNSHPTAIGRQGWEQLRRLLNEQPAERSAAPE